MPPLLLIPDPWIGLHMASHWPNFELQSVAISFLVPNHPDQLTTPSLHQLITDSQFRIEGIKKEASKDGSHSWHQLYQGKQSGSLYLIPTSLSLYQDYASGFYCNRLHTARHLSRHLSRHFPALCWTHSSCSLTICSLRPGLVGNVNQKSIETSARYQRLCS